MLRVLMVSLMSPAELRALLRVRRHGALAQWDCRERQDVWDAALTQQARCRDAGLRLHPPARLVDVARQDSAADEGSMEPDYPRPAASGPGHAARAHSPAHLVDAAARVAAAPVAVPPTASALRAAPELADDRYRHRPCRPRCCSRTSHAAYWPGRLCLGSFQYLKIPCSFFATSPAAHPGTRRLYASTPTSNNHRPHRIDSVVTDGATHKTRSNHAGLAALLKSKKSLWIFSDTLEYPVAQSLVRQVRQMVNKPHRPQSKVGQIARQID